MTQCFKCNGYYHKNTACTNNITCAYCGKEHTRKECNLVPTGTGKKCINCETSNQKYKTNHNLEHEATDPACPTLEYHLEVLRGKINYA